MNKKYLYYILLPIFVLLTFMIISSQIKRTDTGSNETGFFKARTSQEEDAHKKCGCAYQ